MKGFSKILYPIALTDMSPIIAPYVVTMAKQFDAEVHLLHVLRRFDWFVDTYVSDPPEPDFKRIASDIGKADVVSGTNYKQIIQYVASEDIDLIIMGTGSTLQKVMFGAVAEKVSRLSTVPVMLIKSSSKK